MIPISRILDCSSFEEAGSDNNEDEEAVIFTLSLRNSVSFVLRLVTKPAGQESRGNVEIGIEEEVQTAVQSINGHPSNCAQIYFFNQYKEGKEQLEQQRSTFLRRMREELNTFNCILAKKDRDKLLTLVDNYKEVGPTEATGGVAGTYKPAFVVCSTYPEKFMLPEWQVREAGFVEKVAEFREKRRIPCPVYVYHCNGVKSSIWRSGQIKKGLFGGVSKHDKKIVEEVALFNSRGSPEQDWQEESKTSVFDCRPFINALGNQVAGKGYITKGSYDISEVVFGQIENIHVMRESFRELRANVDEYRQFAVLGQWIGHLRAILAGACFVQGRVLEGRSVLVNCSDGWDRTAQVTTLGKMLVDPYFRTVDGFRGMLFYDWIGFGHKFRTRQEYANNHECSPVFLQFLDCVHQLVVQQPNRFEFGTGLLLQLYQAYSENCFDEFSFDSTEDYIQYFVGKGLSGQGTPRGLGIWELIESNRQSYLNPSFEYAPQLQAFRHSHPELRPSDFFQREMEHGRIARFTFDSHGFVLRFWKEAYYIRQLDELLVPPLGQSKPGKC